uniref:Chemokine interleukin-8-like domain-containing protein n=1 Tax=Mola mola TaxID=94237 RepID=A0A3Q4ATG3_MOLML
MVSSQIRCALLLTVVAGVCVQLYQAHDILGRCACQHKVKFIKANITDFQVLQRRPACDKTELYVTVSKPDNTTEDICLHMEGKMAKAFLKCWERINRNKTRKTECFDRKRKSDSEKQSRLESQR